MRIKSNLISMPLAGLMTIILLFLWMATFIGETHPYLGLASIAMMFIASYVIFLMSFERSFSVQLICLLLILFYVHRVAFLYFIPEQLTYLEHVKFSYGDLNKTSFVFLVYIFAVYCGIFFGKKLFRKREKITTNADSITYFGMHLDFKKVFVIAAVIYIVLTLCKFYIYAQGIGFTGMVYTSEEVSTYRLMGMQGCSTAFMLYFFFYLRDQKVNKKSFIYRLSKLSVISLVIAGFLISSKAFLLSLITSFFIYKSVSNLPISKKYYIISIAVVLISITLYFPLISIFRKILVHTSSHWSTYFDKNIVTYIQGFSSRCGAFDWMNLWLSVPTNEIPSGSTSIFWNFIGLINKLLPHSWSIAQPESVNLSKLQVILGRGFGNLDILGGHGENQGGLATVYLFCGLYGGSLYLFFWSFALIGVERSNLHPFWKYTIVTDYIMDFLSSGGSLIIRGHTFYFLILLAAIAVSLKFSELFLMKKRNRTIVSLGT